MNLKFYKILTNISKQEKLSIFFILTLTITSIGTYANVNNFSLQKIKNKETPTKLNPKFKLSRNNPQEKKTIKFSQLKELLKQNNENLKVIESQIEQSKNILNSKIAAWSPRLKISSNEVPKFTTGDTRNKFLDDSSSNQLKVGVNTTFEWDIINPTRRLEIRIARDKLENLSDIYKATYKDLYLEALKIYYSIYSSKEEIKVAEKSIEISKVALNEANNRFKSGLGNKLDLLESKTQLHRNQLRLIKKVDQYNSNLNKLGEILNIKNDFYIKDNNRTVVDLIWFADQKESEIAAFKNRLDVEVKRRNIKINDNESLVVIAAKKPNLNLYNTF